MYGLALGLRKYSELDNDTTKINGYCLVLRVWQQVRQRIRVIYSIADVSCHVSGRIKCEWLYLLHADGSIKFISKQNDRRIQIVLNG